VIELAAISVRSLTKYYGTVRGIEDINLDVKEGEIFGFIGPNGAGKSTTIRLLMQLIFPTSGTIRVLGHEVRGDSPELRRRIGYLPGEVSYYSDLTGRQLMAFIAKAYGITDLSRIEEYADRLGLDLSKSVKSYSLGNRKKLSLVHVLMHDPELLILDEPTSGLDPLVQATFFDMIRERREAGATVFLSTHVLSEVDKVCDRVAIIRNGSLVSVSKVSEVPGRDHRYIDVTFREHGNLIEKYGLTRIDPEVAYESGVHHFRVRGEISDALRALADHPVSDLVVRHPSLEEIFLEFYKQDGAQTDNQGRQNDSTAGGRQRC
jgi:ABC-2 type transport system ATP-binding protein